MRRLGDRGLSREVAVGAKIITVGEDIRLEPAVDGWALDNERLEAYPRIGDFIALAAITDIPTLRALWLDLYPNIGEGGIFDLPGGLCPVEDGGVLVEPQCCADFSDIGRWRTLTDSMIRNGRGPISATAGYASGSGIPTSPRGETEAMSGWHPITTPTSFRSFLEKAPTS